MNTELKQTELKDFTHHLCDGEQVVRNPKVQALMVTKLSGVKPDYLKILATPVFSGSRQNEIIHWQTDIFSSAPVALASLSGIDKSRYIDTLENGFNQLGAAISSIKGNPAYELLRQAITFHSYDNVFCADGKVVITEWGMHPKNHTDVRWLPFGVNFEMSGFSGVPSGGELREESSDISKQEEREEREREEREREKKEMEEKEKGWNESEEKESEEKESEEKESEEKESEEKESEEKKLKEADRKRKFYMWLIPAALLLALLILMLSRCNRIPSVNPEINPEDVVPSRDSMTMEVSDRFNIFIVSGGSVNEFVSEFKRIYPEDKYMLSNPDTLIPRVTLILPKEEKESFMELLPDKFPEWELEILPETIFGSTGQHPNDPAFNDSDKRWYFDMCSVFDAWDVTQGDKSIVVAIIDDGFDLSHPELKGRVTGEYNAVTHTRIIFPSESGHGTHVSATAIGNINNSEGSSGIAPQCQYMPIQVGDRNGIMTSSAIFDAVLYAIQKGADVVNMSLGMKFSPFIQFIPVPIQRNYIANNFLAEERVWNKIFSMADKQNVTFVLAGGNDNVLIGLDPMQRSKHTIKVSAVQPDKRKANFSNFGDYSTLSAPGVNIYSAVPGNKYQNMDGTSMASPIVAGGVALLKSKNPGMNTQQIVAVLQRTGISSPSMVGPIVNFAKALADDSQQNPAPGPRPVPSPGKQPGTGDESCRDYQKEYDELLAKLEKLKKEHPECISAPDTLTIPVKPDLADFTGTWKSTTSLFNNSGEEVVLYFTFNGTSTGSLSLVEPDNTRYDASLAVSITNDKIFINQTEYASGPQKSYPPYKFVCRPDKNRRADCNGENITDASNKIHFNLVRLNY